MTLIHDHVAELHERKRKARRRTNIEDAITVVLLMLMAFIAGIRVQAVYLTHEPEPVKCNSEDEVSVMVTDDGYDLNGTTACVHIDYLEKP